MNELTATQVAYLVGVTEKTLSAWYKYINSDEPKPKDMPKLPMYKQTSVRGKRTWNESDIEDIKRFKDWIPHGRNGCMGRISERNWSHEKRKEAE